MSQTYSRTLLIVEDDPGLLSQMRWCFDDMEVIAASDRDEATQALAGANPAVITLDLGLPPDAGGTREGFAFLEHIRRTAPRTKVIVITGREEKDHAIQAIATGAYDYYQKPIDSKTLRFVVERAFRLSDLETENRQLQQRAPEAHALPGIVGASPVMVDLCNQVRRVAPTEISVLLSGETGTGKEIITSNIHRLSARSKGPLIAINCAAIPENLQESELFGHEKGSFTGAHARKIGKVEAATGGTLFLDEIGDMPMPLQAKILRFIQERSFERVGGNQSIAANVRVISATHRDLQELIAEGRFREDLYYRLSEFSLTLPSLKARGGDVLLIADYILNQNQHGHELRFSRDAINAMESWGWPGNIRELENRVRRGAILCERGTITAADLELSDVAHAPVRKLKEVRAIAEKEAIRAALLITSENISEASRLLGVSRPTLYNLIEKYDISTGIKLSEEQPPSE